MLSTLNSSIIDSSITIPFPPITLFFNFIAVTILLASVYHIYPTDYIINFIEVISPIINLLHPSTDYVIN